MYLWKLLFLYLSGQNLNITVLVANGTPDKRWFCNVNDMKKVIIGNTQFSDRYHENLLLPAGWGRRRGWSCHPLPRTVPPPLRRTGPPPHHRTGSPTRRRTGSPSHRRTGPPSLRRTGPPPHRRRWQRARPPAGGPTSPGQVFRSTRRLRWCTPGPTLYIYQQNVPGPCDTILSLQITVHALFFTYLPLQPVALDYYLI